MPFLRHVLIAALVGGALACNWDDGSQTNTDDNDFRPDVFQCEDALARLSNCCPGFIASEIRCVYFEQETTGGCEGSSSSEEAPAFSVDESTCILQSSCDTLVATGVCSRAQSASSYSASSSSTPGQGTTSQSSGAHAEVCP